ncbi:NUDIX domain-containing protein [Tropicimonas marinistellae]|uniref:NUDIX domain-containing protein n=1 Tax=Tropicimonas marinistellae TaxID=1739787 RepID=UPI00082F4D68|nr:gamma-glutamylcyclotransferase [Tropicimonas marinistellae]
MAGIFFYGTLCHAPLRALVLGEDATERLTPACLKDHAVVCAADESFPMIVAREGAEATGLLLANPTAEMVARMDYYEGGFGYQLGPVEVWTETGPVPAQMYLPPAEDSTRGEDWDIEAWANRWGPLTCLTAEEILLDMDKRPATEVAHRFGPLRARAQARLNARRSAPTTLRRRAIPDDIRLRRRNLVYSRFFSVEEYDFAHKKFSGDYGAELNRTAFISADAVTVLPYDPVRDRVLLIEQFRAGPYARGDAQPWMLEPIAGRIDGGEVPEQSARREAREEAGLELGDLHLVAEYYPTPGAKSEYLFAYIATADLPDDAAGIAGLETEGEDIRSHIVPLEQAMALVESGEINVGPLILLLLHLSRMRESLRGDS